MREVKYQSLENALLNIKNVKNVSAFLEIGINNFQCKNDDGYEKYI